MQKQFNANSERSCAVARNIEIKARVGDLAEVETRARAIATEGPVNLAQDDTFFACAKGRLKLRQFPDGRGELIHYFRADDTGPKVSDYLISPTAAPEVLRQSLSRALGTIGRVRKRRRVYMVDRTRIHLDEVEGLGAFVELEIVLREGESAEAGEAVARQIMGALGIDESQLVRGAYVDMQGKQSIGLVSLVVREYDEALAFYVGILGFSLVEDTHVPEQGKRWVVVAPPGSTESRLLLARASSGEQTERIGNQTGGRVFLFLYTDNFARDYQAYKAKGVTFVREPREEPYGTVAVFKDLYGNLWDLLQPRSPT